MRLYLSSFRMGDKPEQLLALIGASGRGPGGAASVAVVANAMDDQPAHERPAGVEREFAALAGLGLRPTELDLRDWFDRPAEAVRAALSGFDAVWLRGGNVFMLRHALARSGADVALTALLREDALVCAGYSAGPCVLAPSLDGLELCDDRDAVPRIYGEAAVTEGLGLLDFAFVPHVDSPAHPGTAQVGRVAAGYRAAGTPHVALRDGQVLVVDAEGLHGPM
ncbi:Type 1 glutamine amidotransferase-like domain-containing protein [Streptacidiphilus rugosus]|uniref:Type 1 glutamine amidotransferase-like domain-containing protein n=1 Tax=Streptacidiphilus rugosus TaxID=405783 RepID=UPI00055B75C7|nr:Type 1 glutamine amidotransferase-like domain-containing protein [Streptacidiphilus rugosus]